MRLIFLGAPGCGKGTQAALVKETFGIPCISTGDILRKAVLCGLDIGVAAQTFMNRGVLVPDDIIIELIKKRLKVGDWIKKGFLFDGFPRTIPQAEALDKLIEDFGCSIDRVLSIEVKIGTIIERLSKRRVCIECGANYHLGACPPKTEGKCDKCGGELYQREDDKDTSIKERLNVYFKEAASLKAYYKKKGILTEINGEGTIQTVHKRIIRSLEESCNLSSRVRKL